MQPWDYPVLGSTSEFHKQIILQITRRLGDYRKMLIFSFLLGVIPYSTRAPLYPAHTHDARSSIISIDFRRKQSDASAFSDDDVWVLFAQ